MFPSRDLKPSTPGSVIPIQTAKKNKEKKPISDLYYDKVSYRESRNIFSANEPIDPENRLYTDLASQMHSVWTNTINIQKPLIEPNEVRETEGQKLYNSKITQSFLKELSKVKSSTNSTPIGCKKCGYVGHFQYECRNFLKSKKNEDKQPIDNEEKKEISIEKKKKHKKEKKKKHKKSKKTSKRDHSHEKDKSISKSSSSSRSRSSRRKDKKRN